MRCGEIWRRLELRKLFNVYTSVSIDGEAWEVRVVDRAIVWSGGGNCASANWETFKQRDTLALSVATISLEHVNSTQ